MADIKEFMHQHERLFRRWAVIVLAVSIVAACGTYVVMSRRQTYSAHVNIKFTSSSAANGYANDGSLIADDILEIMDADVLAQAIDSAGMTGVVTPNDLSPNLSVDAVIPDDEQDKIDSALDNGKDYTYVPVEYKISLTTKYPETGKLLSYIADSFETSFAQNHTGIAALPSSALSNYSPTRDFIETAELLDEHISAMKTYAETNADSLSGFRSSTGYAYSDLAAYYARLSEQDLPRLYALILANKATLDPTLLRQKLHEQADSNTSENDDTEESIEELEALIASYSEKNKANGTVANGFGDLPIDENHTGIIDGVYENTSNPESAYDQLFSAYNNENDAVSFNSIDSEFSAYLLSIYEDVDEPTDEEITSEINAEVSRIVDVESEYYQIAQSMKSESDEMAAGAMIRQMNTPVAEKSTMVKLYSALAFAAAFMLMCILLPAGHMLIKNISAHIRDARGSEH